MPPNTRIHSGKTAVQNWKAWFVNTEGWILSVKVYQNEAITFPHKLMCLSRCLIFEYPVLNIYYLTMYRPWNYFFFFLNIYLFAPGLIYLFIFIFIFIFIFGCVGSSFLCEGFLQLRQAGTTHHRGAQAPSPSRPLLLQSTGPRRAGSAAVAHGPSRSAACGILPDQGSNPHPPH